MPCGLRCATAAFRQRELPIFLLSHFRVPGSYCIPGTSIYMPGLLLCLLLTHFLTVPYLFTAVLLLRYCYY